MRWIVRLGIWMLALSGLAGATEREPWLGNLYELEFRLQGGYQWDPSENILVKSSLGATIAPDWAVEAEVAVAKTERHCCNFGHGKLATRYRILDDILGDCYSLVVGGGLLAAPSSAVDDIHLGYRGEFESNLFASFGQEWASEEEWEYRWWALVGGGLANRGSPWVEAEARWERRWCERHRGTLFSSGLFGFGSRRIEWIDPFKGYGPIQYRMVDIGVRYTYEISYWGELFIEYAYQVYSRSYLTGLHRASIGLFYPFGL